MSIRVFLIAHVILGPLGIYILVQDMNHPERWSIPFRNPAFSIPFCIVVEAFILSVLVFRWKKVHEHEEGLRLLKEANRLLALGFEDEAEAAYQKGCWLCGIQRK